MKLVSCSKCHAQYDVTGAAGDTIACRCGGTVATKAPVATDAPVTRCSACGALVGETDRTCPYCQATVMRVFPPAGPVCPQCYARNPEGAKHCTACGVAFDPQPIGPTEAGECPACAGGIRLGSRNLGGLWVDECPSCLGVWAPGDVMDRLVARVRERYQRNDAALKVGSSERKRSAAWQSEVAYRKCPVCKGTMQRKNFAGRSGVVLDWCGNHGVWLDSGEMEDIAAFVLGGGLERGRADEKTGAWSVSGDPARAATVVAAEQIMAEERARTLASREPRQVDWDHAVRGVGDFLAKWLK